MAPDGRADRPTVLALDSVVVYYGNVLALDGVSLDVRQGEIVCLLGGNASGKTTTMKAVLGIVRPQGGSVRLKGQEVQGLSPAAIIRSGVAMVPENREVFPTLSVHENLLLGSYTRRKDAAGIRESLERVHELFPLLADRREQKAGTLSGGEQQMVAMGRALMAGPTLLLMDEPSMGLSPALVQQSFGLISRIRSSDVSVLLVEQNATQALDIADRGYVLQSGRIAMAGSASELRVDPDLHRAYLG